MNILFVCSRNRWRSLTAEHVFKKRPGYSVRSAGTSDNARVRVKTSDITWAELIFVMEPKHRDILNQKFAQVLQSKKLICLGIEDHYKYMDEELIQILESSVSSYLPLKPGI